MDETIDQVVSRLRTLAVEMVRAHRLSDAAAVLAGVGAVEMMDLFAEPKPADSAGGAAGAAAGGTAAAAAGTPGVTGNGVGGPTPAAGGGQHRAPEFDQH